MAPGAIFTTQHFLLNDQMGPISYSVKSHKAGKVCQGQTLLLIEPICKLQRK